MSPPERSPEVERLLEQSGWARGLALRLVGDAQLADDVVQDALVAALERPPRGPRVREWFGVVVRNLALRRRRREAARSGVERDAARREAVGGGEEALQRLELQHRLAELLLGLAEPYRTAVVLRHVEGLSAREIARRQHCSEEAARQRVARGLARLRSELDERSDGDRSVWCGAIAALYGVARDGAVLPASLSGAGATVIGGTLMGAKTIAAVAAVGLTLGGAAWWMNDGGASEPARPRPAQAIAPEAGAARAVARDVEPAVTAAGDVQRDAVAVAPAAVDAASPPLVGRTLDSLGAPLEGVEVQLLADEGDDVRASAASDASGAFAFADLDLSAAPADHPWRLRAEHGDLVPLEVRRAGPDLGELVLVQRPRIHGVVLRPDGTPVAPPGRVQLDVILPSGEREVCGADVDERGRFTTTDLLPGVLVDTHARVRGFARGNRSHDLTLQPGTHHELTLTVPAGATVRGVVIDSQSHRPVPFAEVWADGWTYDADSIEPSTVADAEGRFELRGVHVNPVQNDFPVKELGWVQVSARAEGYLGRPFARSLVHLDSEGFSGELALEITRADAAVVGRLTWPDGSPAKDIALYGLDDGPNFHFEFTDDEGRFAFEGLHPGPFHLCARTDAGDSEAPQGRSDAHIELTPGARETVELVLAPADGTIRGRVVDGQGRALQGVSIEAGEHMIAHGLTMGLGNHRATTDADGRYTLDGLGPGRYQVELPASELRERAARPAHVQIDLEAEHPRDGVDFELVPGVSFAGWIDIGENDPSGYSVTRRRTSDREFLDERSTDRDGRFRFDACWPEPCTLSLMRAGRELARLEVGAGGAEGLVLAGPR